jgi:hypothetical protein
MDTVPTSNLYSYSTGAITQPIHRSPPPPSQTKTYNNNYYYDGNNPREMLSQYTDESQSQLTLGDTITSDLTMTTGGTFSTSNAVVLLGDEDDDDDDDDDDNNDSEKERIVHNPLSHVERIDTADDVDTPLDQLFAHAQRRTIQAQMPPKHPYTINETDDDEQHQEDIDNGTSSSPGMLHPDVTLDVTLETGPASNVSDREISVDVGGNNSNIDDDPVEEFDLAIEQPPDVSLDLDPSNKQHQINEVSATDLDITLEVDPRTVQSSLPPSTPTARPDIEAPVAKEADIKPRGVKPSEATATCSGYAHNMAGEVSPLNVAPDGVAVAMGAASTSESQQQEEPPIKVVHAKESTLAKNPKPYMKYLFRGVFVGFVLFIVILSASLYYTRRDDSLPSTTSPPLEYQPPSVSPSGGYVTDFEASVTLDGLADGVRFGTIVSLSSNGEFMAVLSSDASEPVQIFEPRDGKGWVPLPGLPLNVTSDSSSYRSGSDIDIATTSEGLPVVAVSHNSGFESYEYNGREWVRRGQSFKWASSDSTEESVALFTAICLSSDATVMATGFVNHAGNNLVVSVLTFDPITETWNPKGQLIRRVRPEAGPPFLSMTLALSGDGTVLAVGDWAIADPQVILETYEWREDSWSSKGSHLTLPWGPVDVALSNNGQRVALVNIALGTSYEWDGYQWTELGSGFVGGASVAITGTGTRILVGDPLQSRSTVLDYQGGTWVPSAAVTGTSSTRFGESVAMTVDGNTISIGAPLFGNTAGQVTVFC